MKSSNVLKTEEVINILKEILKEKGAILYEKKVERSD